MRTQKSEATGIAARAAMWSARHRVLAIFAWLAFVAGITVLSGLVGHVQATDNDYGNGESGQASRVIEAAGFERYAGEMVLIQGDAPGDAQAAVADVTQALRGTGQIQSMRDPVTSEDGRSILISFDLSGDPDTAPDRVTPVLDAVSAAQDRHPGLYIGQAGAASGDKLIGEFFDEGLNRLSMLSIPVTLGILLVAFGAIVAALLPVLLAVTAIIAAFGLLAFASHLAPSDDATMHVMLLIGLAVGVDYCLFYIRRERDERAKGADAHRALLIAAQTSGRSIWISGLTVIIAMAGMFLTQDVTFVSFAIGTILVVATAVLGSLTVLPALLSTLGDRVDFGKIPGLYRRRTGGRVWSAVLGAVLRRPLISAVVAASALGALAIPTMRLHTVGESLQDFSPDAPLISTLMRIEKAFPGGSDPAVVVVKAQDVTAPAMTGAIEDFRRRAVATGQLHEPITVEVNPDRTVAVVSVGLSGSGTDETSTRALETLRASVVPDTLGRQPGAWVGVTGNTAADFDFNHDLKERLPFVFGFVLGLAFLLLLVAFRSVVVAVTGVLLNCLSVAAAYGLIVLIFQDGHGAELLDFTANGGITNWMPLMLFVILFGLSMDYHVFVLSRIREGYDRGLPTRQAVHEGIVGTAGVITSAAVVMVAVFSLFATMPVKSMKELAVGLAAAILIDATIVRAVLLPAVMALLGDRNFGPPKPQPVLAVDLASSTASSSEWATGSPVAVSNSSWVNPPAYNTQRAPTA
jgi:putative drug exporter of the RND superfamily